MTRKPKPKPKPIVPAPVVPAVTQPQPITVTQRNWLREAISDDQGLADMAYVAIGGLTLSAVGALAYITVMATVSYIRCTHIVDTGTIIATTTCVFDPLPLGQAAGLIFGAFAALIGALAGYMAATRRPPKKDT